MNTDILLMIHQLKNSIKVGSSIQEQRFTCVVIKNCAKTELDSGFNGSVTVASGQTTEATGRGKVVIQLQLGNSSMEVALQEVLLVPQLDGNLVSVKKLVNNGFSVMFTGEDCFLINGDEKLLIAKYRNKLYTLCETEKCFKANAFDESDKCIHEWHRRLSRTSKLKRHQADEGRRVEY
jgi:hypothetical protein